MNNESPFVSIIVPMFNSEETIDQCLQSLLELDYPRNKYEIIVVDHSSTDKCSSIVRTYPVHVVKKIGGTIASVRNFGAQFATGQIYAFVDSDCEVRRDWVDVAVEQLIEDDSTGATGCGYITPKESSWVEMAWLYESEHSPFETDFIPCGNFIVKADVFIGLQGFNENLTTCEDADICQRIVRNNYKVINNSKVKSVHLQNPKTIKQFFLKEIWYGKNMTDTSSKFYLDKVLLATIFYIVSHLFMLTGISLFIITGSSLVMTLGFFSIALLCVSSTLYRVKRSKKYYLFFHTFFLYYIYFCSRSFSFLKTKIVA